MVKKWRTVLLNSDILIPATANPIPVYEIGNCLVDYVMIRTDSNVIADFIINNDDQYMHNSFKLFNDKSQWLDFLEDMDYIVRAYFTTSEFYGYALLKLDKEFERFTVMAKNVGSNDSYVNMLQIHYLGEVGIQAAPFVSRSSGNIRVMP